MTACNKCESRTPPKKQQLKAVNLAMARRASNLFSLHVQLAFGMGKTAIVCIGDSVGATLSCCCTSCVWPDAQCVLFCAPQLCTMTSFGYGMGQLMVDSLRQVTKKAENFVKDKSDGAVALALNCN